MSHRDKRKRAVREEKDWKERERTKNEKCVVKRWPAPSPMKLRRSIVSSSMEVLRMLNLYLRRVTFDSYDASRR